MPGKIALYSCAFWISWFWFVGAIYLTQLPNFTLHYLGGNEQVVTLLLALFSVVMLYMFS